MSLKTKRGVIKGSVTRIIRFVESLDESQLIIPSIQEELKAKLEYLTEVRDKLSNLHEQIIAEDGVNVAEEEDNFDELYATIDNLDTSIRVIINKKNTASNTEVEKPPKASHGSNENLSDSKFDTFVDKFSKVLEKLSGRDEIDNVKLEPIKVPTFSGSYEDWPTFKDIFLSSIGNSQLPDSHKMQYLISYLKDEPLRLVQRLKICDANYRAAWELLSETYDDLSAVINDSIQRFLSLPNIKPSSQTSVRQFRTTCNSILHSLDTMQATGRDIWLVYWASQRLDHDSKILWANTIKGKVPTWERFDSFLEGRAKALAIYTPPIEKTSTVKSQPPPKATPRSKQSTTNLLTTDSSSVCDCCEEGQHRLYKCPKFEALSPSERLEFVKSHNLCRNCFGKHMTKHCQSSKCKKCSIKHSTLLHDAYPSSSASSQSTTPQTQKPAPSDPTSTTSTSKDTPVTQTVAVSSTVLSSQTVSKVFLATAVVKILDRDNNVHLCRAILDSGAQMNLMTQELCQKLKLNKSSSSVMICGVTNSHSLAKHQTDTIVQSRINDTHLEFNSLVVPKIAGNLPNWEVDTKSIPLPQNVILADPTWNVTQPIDILIGAAQYFDIVKDESIKLGPGLPQLKNTDFGWIIVGAHTSPQQPISNLTCCLTTLSSIDKTLKKFWEVENVPSKPPPSQEHKEVEQLFSETTVRDSTGRYVLHLPLRSIVENLGDNKTNATRQFLRLEKRLAKSPQLKADYANSIQQYLNESFLEPISNNESSLPVYYLPHHPVVKESSTTTKVRVVYNASSRSSTGLSLNDVLKVGPTVQPELVATLMLFRRYPIALSADIRQMYPQFLLHPPHRDLQRILWRNSTSEPIKEYRLTGVCFGVASSPFLATRALNQLAIDEQDTYPRASHAILHNFYVDDCLLSCHTIDEALNTQQQLINLTKSAGLTLTKWCSNRKELLQITDDSTTSLDVPEHSVSTLGMKWNAQRDVFHYEFSTDELPATTKRQVFSVIARLFDPEGFLGPLVVRGKIFMQSLWQLGLSWDDQLPPDLLSTWETYLEDLKNISIIEIPRWASTVKSPTSEELHMFCDSSQTAYGAVLYYVTADENHRSSHLIYAKSRVAPLASLSIPRLELLSAVLGAQIMDKFRTILNITSCFYWTDSMVVYHQIRSSQNKFDSFVVHKIGLIHTLSQREDWHHVPGILNPADIISRGSTVQNLHSSSLWWHGPSFLLQPTSEWPQPNSTEDQSFLLASLPEEIQPALPLSDFISKLVSESSDYSQVTRVLAISFRFLSVASKSSHSFGPISVTEIHHAEVTLLKWEQNAKLSEVAKAIENNTLNSNGSMKTYKYLSPFIDKYGLIRVGGRLSQSDESYDTRHPILLPKGELARLIATHEHRKNLHAGPQLLLSILRQRFWPLGARNLTRQVVHNCVRCIRCKPRLLQQFMGDLPQERVIATSPFHNTGVDFCGPMWVRPDLKRGGTSRKAYVAVFICLSTKAVHLELVSNLSCEAFIAALRRFAARRSAPLHIFSDNATNFTSADKELQSLLDSQLCQEQLSSTAISMGITWHFQPPRSPHHGGLWESAVKSLKHHLLRTIGDRCFTYEDLYTILTQVESILNSRPLTTLSDDPSEPSCLTPGHFLVGKPLNAVPSPSLQEIPLNRLDHWQLCQRIIQKFSHRWRLEYLTELQRRTKWFSHQPNLKIGDLVIIHEDNAPSHQWPLGIIHQLHPGKDSKVRVVTVRTPKGLYKRSIAKICRLPSPEDDQLATTQKDPSGLQGGACNG